MKHGTPFLPALAVALILGLLAAPSASFAGGKPGKSHTGTPAWQWTFNPTTIETVRGTVAGISLRKGRKTTPATEWLSLKTDNGTLPVLLGPASYVGRDRLGINRGDSLSVTGSLVTRNARTVLVATEIEAGDGTHDLFTPEGTPLWSADIMEDR